MIKSCGENVLAIRTIFTQITSPVISTVTNPETNSMFR